MVPLSLTLIYVNMSLNLFLTVIALVRRNFRIVMFPSVLCRSDTYLRQGISVPRTSVLFCAWYCLSNSDAFEHFILLSFVHGIVLAIGDAFEFL